MAFPVRELLSAQTRLELKLVCGEAGLRRRAGSSEVLRALVPSLIKGQPLLARGRVSRSVAPSAARSARGRVWVAGEHELAAYRELARPARKRLLNWLLRGDVPALIFVDGVDPADFDTSLVRQGRVPVMQSVLPFGQFISSFYLYMENRLAPQTTVHGTLVVVFGQGILIQGASGIGKSEIALALVERGHQLVADDVVMINLRAGSHLIGTAPELGRHLLEIRGLGLLNVRHLFGVASVTDAYRIHLIVDLKDGMRGTPEKRLVGARAKKILGTQVPRVEVHVRSGRNMAVIVEAAARNQSLIDIGYDVTAAFIRDHTKRVGGET